MTLEETSLASVLDKMQYIYQNDEGEAHAEVIDQGPVVQSPIKLILD